MEAVRQHYESLLAEVYTWMGGGLEPKVDENLRQLQRLGIAPKSCAKALDLGCGSGFQTLALETLGFDVVAVDLSETLLAELRNDASGRKIRTVSGDFRDATVYEPFGPFEVVVCMGDTLVHLATLDEVASCMDDVRRNLVPGGMLIVSFRDLSHELKGIDRAIPVRMDDERLLTTFLEFEPESVVVNDLLFVKHPTGWQMKKSAYRKLRLAPDRFAGLLTDLGFSEVKQSSERGFWTTTAIYQGN